MKNDKTNYIKLLFFATLMVIVGEHTYAQSPGDVSNLLSVWLRADAGTANIGTSWQDQSGSANHYITATGPTVQNGVHNFNPAVEILSGGFNAPTGAALTANSTIFFVAQKLASDNNGRLFEGNITNSLWGYHDTHEFSLFVEGGRPIAHNSTVHPTPVNSGGLDLRLQSFVHNGTTSIEVRADGQSLFTHNNVNSVAGVRIDINEGGRAPLGQTSHSRVGEFILYDTALTAPEVQRVESYLALKYGITLDQDAGGQDYLASDGIPRMWNAAVAGAFDRDIFGIGRDDNSALIQRQSRSVNDDGIVTLGLGQIAADNASNTNNFGADLNFMTIANDNGGIDLENYNIVHTGITYNTRLSRQWMVQEPNGDVGMVDLQFDADGPIFRNKTQQDIVLLIDADGDFSTGSMAIPVSSVTGTLGTAGASILFDNLTQLNDQTFFTLALRHSSPGSVVNNLHLWLKADAGTSGTAIARWNDQSANGFDAIQGTAADQPSLTASAMNFNPVVSFDGISNYLPISELNYTGTNALNQIAVFAVFRSNFTGASNHDNWAFLDFDRSDFFNFYIRGPGELGLSYGASAIRDLQGTTLLNDNQPHIGTGIYDNTVINDTQLRSDGREELSTDVEPTNRTVGSNNTRFGFVGDGSEAAVFDGNRNNAYYQGDIAEIIYYENQSLTPNEIQRIESYLALKYGITLDQDAGGQDYLASDDGNTVIWDASAVNAATFNNDIAGIFRDNTSGLDQRVSRSVNNDAIVTIALDNNFIDSNEDAARTTGFTSDLSGLTWGNNNGDVTDFVSPDLPVIGNNRWARVWYAQDVNFNSTVNVQFTNPNIEDGVTYYLISETDGDGNFESTDDGVAEFGGVGVIAVGNTVSFSGVNLSNKYFTLAARLNVEYMRHGKFFRKGSKQIMKFGKGR